MFFPLGAVDRDRGWPSSRPPPTRGLSRPRHAVSLPCSGHCEPQKHSVSAWRGAEWSGCGSSQMHHILITRLGSDDRPSIVASGAQDPPEGFRIRPCWRLQQGTPHHGSTPWSTSQPPHTRGSKGKKNWVDFTRKKWGLGQVWLWLQLMCPRLRNR